MDFLGFSYPESYRRNDREDRWKGTFREMENDQNLYRLVKNTGSWKPALIEVIRKSSSSLIHSQDGTLGRTHQGTV